LENQLERGNYQWPTRGIISSHFGEIRPGGRRHQGIDIANAVGTPIYAAASGTVVFSGWDSGGYGNLIILEHLNGERTYYAHNSQNRVVAGQQVAQGQWIADMGSTGRSTGPHLHFEIRSFVRQRFISHNPLNYLALR
jgi:murein DD-endopeptidase MepM/ murein hydrolase activator NlpD